jgi:hypothetical protein
MKKNFLLLTISILFVSYLQARHDYDGCGPLFQPYSVTVKGGVAPTIITDRGGLFAAVSSFNPLVFESVKDPKFNDMWHNYPANIDVDFGFALSNHVELFGEFNARYAKAKNLSFIGQAPTGVFGTLSPELSNFLAYAGYVGNRYFFNRIFCDKLSFFLGLKFGVVNYRKINAKPFSITNQQGQVLTQNTIWFESRNVCSGGLQAGFDILVTKSLSIFFNAEVVASGPMKPLFNFIKEDQSIFPAFTNLLRESSGTVLSFPVTLGLRYYFGGCK